MTAEEYAMAEEQRYKRNERAIIEQMCRDARKPRGMEMLKFFVAVTLGAGVFFFALYWLASAVGRLLENL
jgi:hypothetical protein